MAMSRRVVPLAVLALLAGLAVADFASRSLFFESFDKSWNSRWIYSDDSKYSGKFERTADGIKTTEKNKYYGLTAALNEPVDVSKGVTVQYEVKFAEDITCGGAYLKLLTHDPAFSPEQLVDATPYTIMFGPDKCGTAKTHLILRHKSPITGEVKEHHLKDAPYPPSDTKTHVYTLTIRPDNTFEVLIDGDSKASGSLLEMLDPPINPPKEIADPSDIKPADWVDDAEIADPSDVKPADWDDREEVEDEEAEKPEGWLDDGPEYIDDPSAARPADWDEEEDGEWEAPQVRNPACEAAGCGEWRRPKVHNPAYKGTWSPKMIPNPDYKGEWVQKTMPNPDYFVDEAPLKSIGAIGAIAIEIWTIDQGYQFGNVMVTRDAAAAEQFRASVWKPKFDAETQQDEKERAERMASQDKKPFGVELLNRLLDLPGVRDYVTPHLDAALQPLEQYPALAYAYLAVPFLLLALPLLALLRGGKKAAPAVPAAPAATATPAATAEAKKEPRSKSSSSRSSRKSDASKEIQEDEADEADAEPEEEPAASEPKPRSRATRRKA